MPVITIDIDLELSQLVLSGDISSLLTHRFANRYLKDALSPIVDQEKIYIPCRGDIEQRIAIVRAMLKKYGFHEARSEAVSTVLSDYYAEELKFEAFSRKALEIRNNEGTREDFSIFTDSLLRHMPNRSLYKLQLLSAYHLAFAQNACNFSVPGAGKTSIVYGAFAHLKNLPDQDSKRIDRILVIGPLSSFGPWELEYQQCFGRYPSVQRLSSMMSKEDKSAYLYSNRLCELTLISYASLAALKDDISYFLRRHKVMVVLDEAHKVKNTSGGIHAQTVLDIAQYCSSRVVLTGTPAPNGYEDLYNMFKFIWPAKSIIGYHANQLRDMSGRDNDPRVDGLIESISPFFLRIKKSDLNIPNATVHPPIEITMGPVQQRIYDFIEKKYLDTMLGAGQDFSSRFKKALVSAKTMRLMQAATNPAMLNKALTEYVDDEEAPLEVVQAIDDSSVLSEIIRYAQMETPAKFIAAKNLIEQIILQNGKVVVWATFVQTIKDFQQYLHNNGIASQLLYGATPVEEHGIQANPVVAESDELTRERIVSDFQNPNSLFKVIIANPFAVAESISLHKACHNAIYLERTFNAAHFIQSKDRIHRYGLEPGTVTNYYFLISRDSIDEVIDARLSLKERRMIDIMESMPIPLFDNLDEDLGNEDIRMLIENYVNRTGKIQ